MKIKRCLIPIPVFIIVFSLSSCKKDLHVDNSNDLNFKSDITATSSVMGIYTQMTENVNSINSGFTILMGLYADELNQFSDPNLSLFENSKLSGDNVIVSYMWSESYSTLGQINACIEGLQKSNTLTPSVKKQLLGESKFCRALEYFYLLNIWGDVPLILSLDWAVTRLSKRTERSVVYQQILVDLNDATILLNDNYPTVEKARPNRFAALALLARIYLYLGDWQNAENYASLVINSAIYTPLPALNEVFLKNNKEAIWQLEANGLGFVIEAQKFLDFRNLQNGEKPPYLLSESFIKEIEVGDQRKPNWIKHIKHDDKIYYCPFKYKDAGTSTNTNIREYLNVLRCAEQYLIRAEARAQLNNINGAVTDLNVIRKRARETSVNALPDLSVNLSQAQCLLAVEKERRIELFCELGHRWFDLKRTNRASHIISALKPLWNDNALLFPIPNSEIGLNSNLTQNPGY